MTTTFARLGVPYEICGALERRGITEPFEIQAATIADGLAGRDVCGRAPTGSGKTLAFGIPLVANVARAERKRPTGLVLAPTRELADQIHTELRSFAGDVRIGVVYGGVGYGPQLRALRQGIDVLVACPGRLEDLIDQGAVSLDAVDHVVLDEADRMADMGFMPAVRRLLDQTADARQTVLFSATLDGDVAALTRDYQQAPVRHEVGTMTPDITAASHVFWRLDRPDRLDATADAINAVWPAIVFCRTRRGCDRLTKQLTKRGLNAAPIHGGRSQSQRTRALKQFADGKVQALVATDVAARGIHVDAVALVVHYDLPEDHKTYVHRSGRTARAGEGGVVLSLVLPDQVKDTRRLQRHVGLDEPIDDADAAALRDLSPTPPPLRSPKSRSAEQGDGESHGGQQRNPNKSGRNAQRRRKPKSRAGSGELSQQKKSHPRSGASSKSKGKGKEATRSSQSKRKNTQPKSGAESRRERAGGSGATNGGRPNRKARRAHLQPGAR